MAHYINVLSEFKGLLVLAALPGLATAGYIVLAIAEKAARARGAGGRRKKKKGKNDDERSN